MTAVLDDPLIAGMVIDRMLPLHESSRRLRALYPECPRVYGVAVLADVSRRRWWPLAAAVEGDRMKQRFAAAAQEMGGPVGAAQQLAATLAHTVIGRVVALVILEGRAWDAGLENLWVHVDSEGAFDWVAVVDATLRALPDDPYRTDAPVARGGVVRLPGEAALATWTAHRCQRTLQPLFSALHETSAGAVSVAAMWHMVGASIVAAATQVPQLAGSSEAVAARRGQAILDALLALGMPVRGRMHHGMDRAIPLRN